VGYFVLVHHCKVLNENIRSTPCFSRARNYQVERGFQSFVFLKCSQIHAKENKISINKFIWDIIICPYCHKPLTESDNSLRCNGCSAEYYFTPSGQLDLKLKKPKKYNLEFQIGNELIAEHNLNFTHLKKNFSPEVDFSAVKIPRRLTQELLSYFPKAKEYGSTALDLGCGGTIHKDVCEHAGFRYIGLDYKSSEATILADAHALPFRDNSLEFILSIALLEHLRYPFIVIKEFAQLLGLCRFPY
jgi:hypothetical protein